jgi:hypothetical protein
VTGHSERDRALDSLAEALAAGVPRRRLLRMAFAAAAAAALPSWVWRPAVALAGSLGPRGVCPNLLPGVDTCDPDQFEISYDPDNLPADAQVTARTAQSTFNGCGPSGGIDLGPLHGLEPPDTPLYLAHFVDACDTHDCCYGMCQQPKADCDTAFQEGMLEACAKSPVNLLSGVGLIYCNVIAGIYFSAVAGGGSDAYKVAQRESCIACRPRCQCSGTQVCCNAASGDYTCFDTSSDPNNCGDCGINCSPTQACVDGSCT